MKESHSGIAVLEDVEEDIFIGFCEYSYKGTYITPHYKDEEVKEESSASASNDAIAAQNGLSVKYDEGTDAQSTTVEPEPFQEPEPPVPAWDSHYERKRRKKKVSGFSSGSLPEAPYEDVEEESVRIITPHDRLWKEFRARHFQGQEASLLWDPDLQFHAKLYVFANRFLIKDLPTQCLKALHQDLCNFSLNKDRIPQILDLLEFTYKNTATDEPGGRSRLRELVIHYVACEARTLADDERLQSLLAENGEIGSDLVMKLVK